MESYHRCHWFCVAKKNGGFRIVHDLQPLNKVSIRDAGLLPIVDDLWNLMLAVNVTQYLIYFGDLMPEQ